MNADTLRSALLRWIESTRAVWEARSRRERLVLTGALVLVGLALADAWGLQPLQRETRRLNARIAEAERALTEMGGGSSQSELAGIDRRIEQTRTALIGVDNTLASLDGRVVSAEAMVSQVRELLALAKGLTVLGFRNDAPVPAVNGAERSGSSSAAASGASMPAMASTTVSAPAARSGSLYRHPLEVRVQGSYADITAWLARIEAQLKGIQLGGIQLESVSPGRVEARVQCFTLSKEPVWLTL